jgi:hypothetical protein
MRLKGWSYRGDVMAENLLGWLPTLSETERKIIVDAVRNHSPSRLVIDYDDLGRIGSVWHTDYAPRGGSIKRLKYEASSSYASIGRTCILIRPHDNQTACMPIYAAHRKDILTALDVRTEHLLIVPEAVASFLGRRSAGIASMASSRCACWNTARTSMTESISSS